ncbi:MAG TPA: DUF6600 domain-containing protein, partial [Verrucomicrobiae bacterium]
MKAALRRLFIALLLGQVAYAIEPPPPPVVAAPPVSVNPASLPPAPATTADTNAQAVGMFYDSLAPYGEWIWIEPHGWTWAPRGVAVGWRPYTDGSWVYTESGWTWMSDQAWGWAPFHYGRWFFHDHYGWRWVPDTVWGPAWVSWRFGDQWCGWAPMPPRVAWESNVQWDVVIAPFGWCFVGRADFLAPHLHDHILLAARNVTLLRETHDITHFEIRSQRVFNVGIPIEQVERFTGRRAPRLRLVEVNSVGPTVRVGVELRVFRPNPVAHVNVPLPPHEVPPVSHGASSFEELRRREAERDRVEAAQRAQREALEKIHAHELRMPPPGVAPAEIQRRH